MGLMFSINLALKLATIDPLRHDTSIEYSEMTA